MSKSSVEKNWTARLRRSTLETMEPEDLLPDNQPAYVASWIYVFGVLTIASLVMLIATGLVLTLEGPSWWHVSSVGHFWNSMHLWSVELFFVFMVVHLWGKFWMAAWRGKRTATWITGVLAFGTSIVTALTGYLIQTNFDSQWIATQAKDGFNAMGIGAFFNTLNTGQAILLHVSLLPLVVGVIVVWHILLVRRKGVVPPIDNDATIDGGVF
ncbi:MAG: cytochrome b N-terminal domain-containing protein [Actinomycetes bacterium]|jgi:ubiquinol-cytochrome c reductase cytochrome b subunit